MNAGRIPGRAAAARHGWWTANRYLILRRCAQLVLLGLFLTGPLFGVWIAKGTIASSLILDVLPLSDPFILLQSLLARHAPEATALTGAAIVLAVYLALGGRTYCSWVCPINPVTDFAGYLRRKFNLGRGSIMASGVRRWVLVMALAVSAATGALAWEFVNPITALWRALVFGPGLGLIFVAAVFLFDLFAAKHGWCGHLCPVGAFYGLLGKATALRVSARGRERCDDCLDCYNVCPESHVISPALRGAKTRHGPIIASGDCTVCGRCIDVCPERVFSLTHRFDRRVDPFVAPADSPSRSAHAERKRAAEREILPMEGPHG